MKKIGIYIDAFDPISNVQLEFGSQAAELAELDIIYFLTEPEPRHNQGVKALTHRQNMVEAAVQAHQEFGTISLPRVNVDFSEVLSIIVKRFKDQELFFIVAESGVTRIVNWQRLNADKGEVKLIVGLENSSEKELRAQLKLIYKITNFKVEPYVVKTESAKLLRLKIKRTLRANKQPSELPQVVYGYIKTNKLYVSSPSA